MTQISEELRAHLAEIGRKGGKKSKSSLTPERARAMAAKSAEARKKKKG